MTDECVFAIDFTHTSMTAAFVAPDGAEEGAAGFDLCDFRAGEAEPLDKLIALLTAKCRTAPGKTGAVAVAMACELDADRRRIVSFPQASWLNDQPLAEVLEKSLGIPVVMERRAVVRLVYDQIMLGLPADALTVGCYVDTHYENAVWHCGRPVVGHSGAAGNIAHIAIADREDKCFCGKTGCVDLYGAGVRLNQIHTMIFPDTPKEEIFVRHGEHPIFRDYLSMMAYPIAIEANILDPDFVIIGGEVPSMRDFPRAFLEQEILRHSYRPVPGREPTFLPSATDASTGAVSAAQYALGKLGKL